MELAHDRVQRRTLVLPDLELQVPLSEEFIRNTAKPDMSEVEPKPTQKGTFCWSTAVSETFCSRGVLRVE